jgi:hypothetical protein
MKSFRIKLASSAGLALMLFAPSFAQAADSDVADKSLATELFKEGRALLDEGRVAQACRKLEESQRLEPGGGTLLNLALCHEKEGRTASAWVEFTEALGMARRDDRPQRVEFARAHLATLEPSLSRVSIQVPPAADLPDLEVRLDGSAIARAAWGSPIPIDPGEHLLEVFGGGKIPSKQAFTLSPNGDNKTLVAPVLENGPLGQAPSVEVRAQARAADESNRGAAPVLVSSKPSEQTSSPGSSVPGWIFIGIGVATAGAGAYFGALAISQKRDADRDCPNDACSANGERENSDAIRDANFATAGFGVGLAGVVLGTILLATRTPAHPPASAAKRGPNMLISALQSVSLDQAGRRLTISGRW